MRKMRSRKVTWHTCSHTASKEKSWDSTPGSTSEAHLLSHDNLKDRHGHMAFLVRPRALPSPDLLLGCFYFCKQMPRWISLPVLSLPVSNLPWLTCLSEGQMVSHGFCTPGVGLHVVQTSGVKQIWKSIPFPIKSLSGEGIKQRKSLGESFRTLCYKIKL